MVILKTYKSEHEGKEPVLVKYTASTTIDTGVFYAPYIPLTVSAAAYHCLYIPIIDNIRIYGNTVRISNISNKKLLELADNIEFISKIKHSNSCNRTILLSTSIENLVYLKLKGVIHESD